MPKRSCQLKVGIMADSHGNAGSIAGAIEFLKKEHCDAIFHLGDICDSFNPDTVEDCVGLLLKHGVCSLKGNNDHTIVVNHSGKKLPQVSNRVISYLADLPLKKRYREAEFVHSLPFTRELGLASLIGVMGRQEAARFFQQTPRRLLFRGHSHSPEVIRPGTGKMSVERLKPDHNRLFRVNPPVIITCGALTRGYCMIWHPHERKIESRRFDEKGHHHDSGPQTA
jgi:predicted phosphodiesterase